MYFNLSKIIRKYIKVIILLSALLVIIISSSCTNPFAPKLAASSYNNTILGDQTTINGVFDNFRYAYLFKDTVVYGHLLDDNFTFIFRDYDKGFDQTYSREDDMLSTYGLFKAAQNLDLIWNEVIISVGDSLVNDISRGFNLSIVFNPTDIVKIQGRVNLRLIRTKPTDEWKILTWRDESNY